MKKLFIEQPLALPGTANYLEIIFAKCHRQLEFECYTLFLMHLTILELYGKLIQAGNLHHCTELLLTIPKGSLFLRLNHISTLYQQCLVQPDVSSHNSLFII